MEKSNRNLMVVAHPDDEVLFGGAQLILFENWTVICVTNGDNPIRRKEFEKVMYVVGAEYEMWSYYDEFNTPLNSKLESDLKKVLQTPYNLIVTHNVEGEYGHPHHIQIHNVMKKLVGDDLYVFSFNKVNMLPKEIWEEKVKLATIYESQKSIVAEHLPTTRNESITQYKKPLKMM